MTTLLERTQRFYKIMSKTDPDGMHIEDREPDDHQRKRDS